MVSNITYFIHTSSEGHVKFNGGEILRRFVTDLRRLLQQGEGGEIFHVLIRL